MDLNDRIREKIDNDVYKMSGMSYDEFNKLDFDVQQKIIQEYHKNNNKRRLFKKKETSLVMVGSGENAMFVKVKKGTKVMLFDGTVIEAGSTIEEYRNHQEKRINSIINDKPKIKERVLKIFKR